MVTTMLMLLCVSMSMGVWAQSKQTATSTKQVSEAQVPTKQHQTSTQARESSQNIPALQQVVQQTGFFVSATAESAPQQLSQDDPAAKNKLEALAVRFQREHQAQQALLKNRSDLPLQPRLENQLFTAEFKRLPSGRSPEYYFSYNLQGAQTISTDKIWPNGILGLNLAGQQMLVGEWDGGAVRTTHETFGGRAQQMDGATALSDHATHVAGTLIGTASATNENVRGMAYMANLAAYDWNNDEAEMAQAAANGLLVSNHSYGLVSGWAFGDFGGFGSNAWYWFGDIADTVDAGYGRYSEQSSQWDTIANLAPNYLIVKAAGNDRGYGPPANVDSHRVWNGSTWAISTTRRQRAGGNTGYDCISHAGVAKNVLTVGAVQGITGGWLQPSQVVGSSFHGWGPTDDGRVKPDIVAKGINVFSASSSGNANYVSKNGTSMASPTVSGSLILLQQHYRNLNQNTPMSAAMLKALVIHTADEAGNNEGPDYTFGWGLMNTAKAAALIGNQTNHWFFGGGLAQGGTKVYPVYSDGSQPLKVTIAWNDPARNATPYQLNGTTKSLINDLDIRLVNLSDSSVVLPWRLGGLANPAAGAIRADNDRDNVEQIIFNNPVPGMYEVRVTHKGNLTGGQQLFGMVISGRIQQQVMRQVTFRVDMAGITVSPLGVRIAGNFQQWNPATTLMTNTGGSIWEYTASFPQGDTLQYKFVNGNAWGQDENAIPTSCVFTGSTNRWVVVPTSNTVLPAFLFNQCVPASTGPVPITFRVDMTGQTVSGSGVHIAGNFQGWQPGNTPMTAVANNIWEYTTNLLPGTTVQYKFVNGNNWGSDENALPAACSVAGNRELLVPGQATVLPAVLFNQCNAAIPGRVLVTFRVDMVGRAVSDSGVYIAGNFQGWNPSGTRMMPVAGSIWQYTDTFTVGTTLQYKFINGNQWSVAEQLPNSCFNGGDRAFTVPAQSVVLPAVMFASCDTFSVATVPVTFRVNMSGQNIRPQGVHIAGNFQGWVAGTTPMLRDSVRPDIWTYTTSLPVGDSIEWKFINGNSWGFLDTTTQTFVDFSESIPAACRAVGGPNRFVVVPNAATVLPAYLFGSCDTSLQSCAASLVPLGSTSICLNGQVALQLNVNGAVQSVRWTIDGIPYPEGNDSLRIFARSSAAYQAQVTFASACSVTTNLVNVLVNMPHQAFVQANGPLHYQQGQSINTPLNAVPQQQLSLLDSGNVVYNFSFRNLLPSSGWNNVPQGNAANFSGLLQMPADSLACFALPSGSLQGKVALLYRGACAVSDKALNAQRAGAIAVIVVNNLANTIIPNFSTNPLTGDSVTIPVLVITLEDGRKLRNRVVSGMPTTLSYSPSQNAQYSYQWFRNDQPEQGANGPAFVANQTGDYYLVVQTGGSCAFRSPVFPVSQSDFAQTPWVLQNLNQPIANVSVRNIEPINADTAWTLEERTSGVNFNIWFYRTTDGGNSWQAAQIPGTTGLGTSHIRAVNGSTAFVTLFGDSTRQGVYRTTDGGANWQRLPVFTLGGFPNATYFWNAQVGVTLGDPLNGVWQIYRTTDGGNTWNLAANLPAPLQNEFGLFGELSVNQTGELVYPTNSGRFLVSTDQGLTWQIRLLPEGGETRMVWGENGLGLVYFQGSARLYGTENGGALWSVLPRSYGGMGTISSMSMVPGANPQVVVVSGPQGTAYLKQGSGWSSIDGIFHSAVKFVSPTVGWSGGRSAANGQAGIYKWNSTHFNNAPLVGSISGQLRYANAAQSPLTGSFVAVYNAQSGNLEDVVNTQPNGQFQVSNLPVGNYILRAGTQRQAGGVNATDALRVARHFTGLALLQGLPLEAADVNANGNINATDALQVAQRFTGLLNNPMPLRIYFDAHVGGNLDSAASVHMHSGASVDPNQVWQYVVGNWGVPTSPGQMTAMGAGKWMMGMNPQAYYSQAPNGPLPTGSVIDNIGMVFRESGPCTNCLEQKDGNNQDIFLYPAMMNPPLSTWLGVKAAQSGTDGFGAGTWVFEGAQAQVTANNTANAVLRGMVAGDVDGSFVPASLRLQSKVDLVAQGEAVQHGRVVRLPIRIQEGGNLGAMSLVLRYDARRMQPLRLVLTDATKQANAQVKITENEIRLSWFDLAGWILHDGEQILELELLLQYGEVADLGIDVSAESEFADVAANPLSRSILLMPGVVSHAVSASADALSLRNYPNPFAGETNLSFSLPEQSRVELRVMDARGREVMLLPLGEMPAGENTYALKAAGLQAGVYFCELTARGERLTEKAIIRLVVR